MIDEKDIKIEKSDINKVGEITSDVGTPSFTKFRFKAYSDKNVTPGSIVAVEISNDRYLLGRVSESIEHNPYFSPAQLAVKHALNLEPDHPPEEVSFTIYRLYDKLER